MSGELLHLARSEKRGTVTIRKLVLTGTFAAIYTLFRLIPIDKAIGLQGSIVAGSAIIPVIALFLDGPFAIAAVIMGTFIASFAPWAPLRFYGFDFLPGTMNVLLASLLVRGRRASAVLVLFATMSIFILTPFTETFVNPQLYSPPLPYYWLHIVALLVLLSPLSKNIGQRLETANYQSPAIALATIAFTGTMLEHLTGGILTALVLGNGVVHLWTVFYLFYPIERAVLTILAVLIGVPIIVNTRRMRETMSGKASLGAGTKSLSSYAEPEQF